MASGITLEHSYQVCARRSFDLTVSLKSRIAELA